MLRVVRVLRLIKLVRLLRASRVFKRWEARLPVPYSTMKLARSILVVVFTCHWFSCVWRLQVLMRSYASARCSTHACMHASLHAPGGMPRSHTRSASRGTNGGRVQASLSSETPLETWMGEFGYCHAKTEADIEASDADDADGCGHTYRCASPAVLYSVSLVRANPTRRAPLDPPAEAHCARTHLTC